MEELIAWGDEVAGALAFVRSATAHFSPPPSEADKLSAAIKVARHMQKLRAALRARAAIEGR